MKVVEVRNVTYTYPGSKKPALENVNVEISEGELVLIVGPSGSGKSTFVRLLNGLIPHYYGGDFKGDVFVFGLNTKEHSVAELSKKVGLVFQDPENQILTLTVEKEVAFGPENLGLPPSEIRERVEESLKTMNIEHLRYRLPFELSGGEQQRVIIASILAMKPKLLVFDEPTSNLDPISTINLVKAIHELHRLGYTIVVVEHKLDLLVPLVNRIIVFNKGRIVGDGRVEEILEGDVLESVGVDFPRIPKLFKLLAQRLDIALPHLPLTINDGVKAILELLKGV